MKARRPPRISTRSRQKITPFLWFDHQAEEAARYYVSLFPRSKIEGLTRYDESAAQASGRPEGSVLTVVFTLAGQEFVALNGGPDFKFNQAVSFVVNCATQAEIDRYWNRLSAGGEKGQCGWLKDKFGLSWQVVPAEIEAWLQAKDTERSHRVLQAVMTMTKLDLAALKKAYRGR